MGTLRIDTGGSFPTHTRSFSAVDHGHAHAVAEAIRWLSGEVLPEAIEHDHQLHDEGLEPARGFVRPAATR